METINSTPEKQAAAKACLDYNKNMKEVFVTSDLNCFGDKGMAILHVAKLSDKLIDHYKRVAEPAVQEAS